MTPGWSKTTEYRSGLSWFGSWVKGTAPPVQDLWAFQPYTEGTVYNSEFGIDNDVKWHGPTDPDRLGHPNAKAGRIAEKDHQIVF